MTTQATDCGSDIDPFPPTGRPPYRYFNQPIELIPGWDADSDQVLVHRPSSGLQWVTINQCLPVVTCVKLESDQLIAERKNILIFKDLAIDNCVIDVVECSPSPSPSPDQ